MRRSHRASAQRANDVRDGGSRSGGGSAPHERDVGGSGGVGSEDAGGRGDVGGAEGAVCRAEGGIRPAGGVSGAGERGEAARACDGADADQAEARADGEPATRAGEHACRSEK